MSDLKNLLQSEKLHKLERAWQYLTPWQRTVIFTRALWWSLPTIIQVVEMIRARVLSSRWFDRRRPTIHWVGSAPFSQREKGWG